MARSTGCCAHRDTMPDMRKLYRTATFVVLASLALTAAVAGPKAPRKGHGQEQGHARAERPGVPRYGMAVYSDLCVNQESGEYGGQRVTLLNDEAMRLLDLDESALGLTLADVVPEGRVREVLTGQVAGADQVMIG